MSELYLTADTADGKRLSIAPITSSRLARCPEPPADTSGYFLTEETRSDPMRVVTILAHIADADAAFRVGRMFKMV